MAFGKRKHGNEDTAADKGDVDDRGKPAVGEAAETPAAATGDEFDGPFDIDDFDDPAVATQGRHDLGSVLIPVDETAELAVEVNQDGVPTMVWMVTPNGRYNFTAYAAPKTGSLWREVVTEVADSLRKEAAQVTIEDGHIRVKPGAKRSAKQPALST